MVAESLRMKGELEFTRLLRVDGRFEGDLITDKGSLVVGPKGEVIGDLKNMQVRAGGWAGESRVGGRVLHFAYSGAFGLYQSVDAFYSIFMCAVSVRLLIFVPIV